MGIKIRPKSPRPAFGAEDCSGLPSLGLGTKMTSQRMGIIASRELVFEP